MAQRPNPRRPAPRRRPTRPKRPDTRRRRTSTPSPLPLVLLIAGGILVLLAIGGGGFWIWKSVTGQPPAASPTPQEVPTSPTALPGGAPPSLPPPTSTPVVSPTIATPTITPTQIPAPLPSPLDETTSSLILNDDSLDQTMLELINRDRQQNGLAPVAWDETAARAADRHAAEMAANGFFSHWNMAGYGPQYRYNQAGGSENVRENVHTSKRLMNGQPAPVDDFAELVRKGEAGLMESEGHRANILAPEHTHVGAGFAYNPTTGSFYLVQEFVNRYVSLEPLPAQAQVGATIAIAGRLIDTTVASKPIINLAYEPLPNPLNVAALNATGTYTPAGEYFDAVPVETAPDGSFQASAVLDHRRQSGLYSVRVFVRVQNDDVMANEWFIRVE